MGFADNELPDNQRKRQQQVEAQHKKFEDDERESHSEGLSGHDKEIAKYQTANHKFPLTTNFTAHNLDQLKGMIEHANPNAVQSLGEHWEQVHKGLVGDGGGAAPSGNSAYGQLKKAVDAVLEHWEGESADQFKVQADKILKQIANSATHAVTVSHAMTQASHDLRIQKAAIKKIEKPSWFSKAWDSITDSGRDDKYTQEDVKSGNIPKDLIAQANEGYIGAEKEQQLKAVAVMETLGHSYVHYGEHLKSQRPVNRKKEIPPAEPTTPMPTPIPAPSSSASAPSAGGSARTSTGLTSTSRVPETTGPREPGISGGEQVAANQTKVDGLPTGFSGGGTDSVAGGGSMRGVGSGGGVGAGGGTSATGGVPGGGMLGGAAAAGGAAGRGAAGRAGIGGAGGMGRGGGGAAGGKGALGAAGRGALARAKGGVAGAPKGISGGKPATPGGTGLGRGRGGALGAGGRGSNGMLGGGARGTSHGSGDEERDQGSRPDYLVEDEETWTPEDNRSVPRTIE